jgi:hypothetical protein
VSIAAGFLLVDKPSGWTSHDVVAKTRNLLRIKKVGHAGTLDPMATGLVVVGLGRATRLLRFVQGAPKEYVARAVFGVATDSLDADGAILERFEMDVAESEVEPQVLVELELHLGIEEDHHPARRAHPGILVGDLDELEARLRAAGYAVEHDHLLPGYRRFYVHDPFGNRLEFLAVL